MSHDHQLSHLVEIQVNCLVEIVTEGTKRNDAHYQLVNLQKNKSQQP